MAAAASRRCAGGGSSALQPAVPAPHRSRSSDAVRRFYVDSLVHSSAWLAAIIEIIGADRVLLGSDWPFPMGAPAADRDLGALPPELRFQIRRTNAEQAFGRRLVPA
jgi:predicted TIM-barrel fold metal-dependent hydrolase